MKVYIAGKITGEKDYKEKFKSAEKELIGQGHTVLNPTIIPAGFGYEDYMHICFSMIDVCHAVYFLKNAINSPGALREYEYAVEENKETIFQKCDLEEKIKGGN